MDRLRRRDRRPQAANWFPLRSHTGAAAGKALKPLDWTFFGDYDAASGPGGVPDLFGLGDEAYVSGTGAGSGIWLRPRKPGETGLYQGIVYESNAAVDTAYAADLNAGGTDDGGTADGDHVRRTRHAGWRDRQVWRGASR